MRILVAEDDKAISLQICGILRNRGYAPTPVFDGMQATQMAMRNPHPDGIVLDIGMPGGSGIQTIKRLKASSHTMMIPIIVVSGTSDQKLVESALALGAAAFLPKPVDATTLCAAVAEAVGTPPPRSGIPNG
jgi:CheY-like chemotaxis protein